MTCRLACAVLALWLVTAAAASAQEPPAADSAVWKKVHASLFAGAHMEPAEGVITLVTPTRAEDAAIVPIAIRAQFAQSQQRFIDTIWLLVDNNPSPVAAIFRFTLDSGRADIETRIRIEEYTHVRAVAMTSDGKLYMAAAYVKASGGCSAPAGKDAIAAKANLGRMRLRVNDAPDGGPVPAQLMISHPNDSGLSMDQLTRTYAAPHFVRRIDVSYAGRAVLSADVDFSISENPNLRFYVTPRDGGLLEAKVVDNQDLEFTTSVRLDASAHAAGAASARR
jgi:sulfur-oxidizing protein SoxY